MPLPTNLHSIQLHYKISNLALTLHDLQIRLRLVIKKKKKIMKKICSRKTKTQSMLTTQNKKKKKKSNLKVSRKFPQKVMTTFFPAMQRKRKSRYFRHLLFLHQNLVKGELAEEHQIRAFMKTYAFAFLLHLWHSHFFKCLRAFSWWPGGGTWWPGGGGGGGAAWWGSCGGMLVPDRLAGRKHGICSYR